MASRSQDVRLTRSAAALILALAIALPAAASEARTRYFSGPNVHDFTDPVPIFDLRPLEDQMEILERDDHLLAIDAFTGAIARVEIGLEEDVLLSEVRGRIALVITNRRLLAAVPASDWLQARLKRSERSSGRLSSKPSKHACAAA